MLVYGLGVKSHRLIFSTIFSQVTKADLGPSEKTLPSKSHTGFLETTQGFFPLHLLVTVIPQCLKWSLSVLCRS